jgi:tRNA pseudouridine55 synthase
MSQVAQDEPTAERTPDAEGVLIVDKPAGLTSHDVVGRVRRLLRTRRVGHAGTLDPMATGVLVLGVGRATRLLGHLALDTKEYLACARLGTATGTDDAEGEVLTRADPAAVDAVDDERLRAALAPLTGAISQVPSAVSAIKVDGRRAYARVRDGEQVRLAARPVTVSALDLLAVHRASGELAVDLHVECSSGTYVRALARDLGAALGVGGHLTSLRRTRVGPFTLAEARTLDELAEDPGVSLGMDGAVAAAFPVRRDLDAEQVVALGHGRSLEPAGIGGTHGAFDEHGRAVALLAERDGRAQPVFVIRPAG